MTRNNVIDSLLNDISNKRHDISHVDIAVPDFCELNTDVFIDYMKKSFKISDLVFDIDSSYDNDHVDDMVSYFFKINDQYNMYVDSYGRKQMTENFYDNANLIVSRVGIYFDKKLNNESEELLNYINKKIILQIKNKTTN